MAAYAAVIGDPVAHSLSPAIHNAAFAALGIDARYEAVTVPIGEVGTVVARMRAERWLGMSVTMPHKATVLEHVDDALPIARELGAANCLFWDGERLMADNTDGAGLVWALTIDVGLGDVARRIGVLGAGGAARAAVAALGAAGATEIVVVNRTPDRAVAASALAPGVAHPGSADDLAGLDIVINATPLGMAGVADGDGPSPGFVPGPGIVAMDLVYHPLETPWLAAARAAGATVRNGVPMLIGQAAAAFERWTGRSAPVDAMRAAVAEALGA